MNCNLLDLLSKNMNLVILVLYAYVLMNHVNDKDYSSMVALTAATLMAICYLKKSPKRVIEGNKQPQCDYEGFTGQDSAQDSAQGSAQGSAQDSAQGSAQDSAQDSAQTVGPVRHLPSRMGPYDGICLQTGNKEYWMASPDNVQLVPNDALYAYLGSQGPLKPVFSDNTALTGPPIEGDESTDAKKMFILANNRTSPNCCPGTFSTSTGCVCTTEKQRNYIAGRGQNKGVPASLEDF